MNANLDDPRLTAHALKELDSSEESAVEALLAASPEARQWVEDVRQTAERLAFHLGQEPCPMLEDRHLDCIDARLGCSSVARPTKPRRAFFWLPRLVEVTLVAALLVVLAAMLLPALSSAKKKARYMALMNDTSPTEFMHLEAATLQSAEFNTESYAHIDENAFVTARGNPLSTFSIDVDTASYALVRRFLRGGQLPPKDAVRIEEMLNYFSYDYPQPQGAAPFSVNVEVSGCPWNPNHRLMRIGLKGREVAVASRPPCNLVFLIDVSGSMDTPNKLPLLEESLKALVRELSAVDRVSIVTYAGAAGQLLEPTYGSQQRKILRALDKLQAGGSTHGSEGINLAYDLAARSFIEGGVNRVILCTDGDFNVGVTSPGDLRRLIEEKAKSGIFLSVLGFGMGNYKDSAMETLADRGNGNYAYIDSLAEGHKVLVEQLSGTLVTIAKDVKIQFEFNPARVSAYRLIGYENRKLRQEDFNDDEKDAGEIGAGHTVTALYEIVPRGKVVNVPRIDPLKYQLAPNPLPGASTDEIATIKLRYKEPREDESRLLTQAVVDPGSSYTQASRDFHFASAVAAFGMVLRDSPYRGTATLQDVAELAERGIGVDQEGYRREFLKLVEQARHLSSNSMRR